MISIEQLQAMSPCGAVRASFDKTLGDGRRLVVMLCAKVDDSREPGLAIVDFARREVLCEGIAGQEDVGENPSDGPLAEFARVLYMGEAEFLAYLDAHRTRASGLC